MTALDFLKSKGLIKDGFTEFVISGEFGQIELTKLLKEYAECINDVSQQRELLIAYEKYTSQQVIGKENSRMAKSLVDGFLANNCG